MSRTKALLSASESDTRFHAQDNGAVLSPQDHSNDLLELPQDILLLVFSLLHPADLVRVRRTCTAFNTLAREPSVWKAVAKRVIAQNDMVIPQHVLDDMVQNKITGRPEPDLLERFATAPTRFISAIHARVADSESRPNNDRPYLWPRKQVKYPEFVDPQIRRLLLLPGGRYLLVEDAKNVAVVNLEDGDTSEASGEALRVVAILQCDADASQPGSRIADWGLVNGSTLRLVLAIFLGGISYEIRVYDVELGTYSSSFVLVASTCRVGSLRTPAENSVILCGTRVVLVGRGYVSAWDFVSNDCSQWPHGQKFYAKMVMARIYPFGDNIAVVSCVLRSVTVFSLALPRRFTSNVYDQLEPWFSIGGSRARVYHPRHTPVGDTFLLFLHTREDCGAPGSSLHVITHRGGRQPVGESPRMRILPSKGRGLPSRAYDDYEPFAVVPCDRAWVTTDALGGERAVLQYMWPRREKDAEGTLTLGYARESKMDKRSFDPTSGRMCVIKEDGTLVVVDYL